MDHESNQAANQAMHHAMGGWTSHAADMAIFEYVDALLADSFDAAGASDAAGGSADGSADGAAAPIPTPTTAAFAAAPAADQAGGAVIDLICMAAPGMDIAIERRCIERMLPALPAPERIAGAPDWCIGRAQTSDGMRVVIDPLRLLAAGGTHSVTCWLLAADGFVLALPELPRVLMLDRDAVVWKTDRSKRPWLAGVAARERCVVLDASGLQQLAAELDPDGTVVRAVDAA